MRLPFARAVAPLYRPLVAAQAEACADLHATAFAHGWSAVEFERLIASASTAADAALDRRTGALAGFVLSRGAAGEAEILTLMVAAPWRGRGVGRQLVDRHAAHLAQAGVVELFLEVGEDNLAARRLYAKTGFVPVGRREGYHPARSGQAAVAALVLRRALG